jgi:protein pelota
MKVLKKNIRHGLIAVLAQSPDDLWYLSQIISPGDTVTARTERKIRLGGKEERSGEVIRRSVKLSLSAEKIDFYGELLRISGKITEAPEDIPKGSYHTITVEEGTQLTIIKQKWSSYELNRLKEAAKQEQQKVLIVVFDREQALFALLKAKGYEVLSEPKGEPQKKQFASKGDDFYKKIISVMKDYSDRYNVEKIILASPAFWKEELLKELQDKPLSDKIVQASCSYVGKGALDEVIKRPELKAVLREGRAAKEACFVEDVMKEIGKNGLVAYGIKEIENSVNAGAVATLLVTTATISKARQNNTFQKIESLMKSTDSMKGDVIVINSENDAGQRLDGIGGIAALLRYKTSY